MKLNLNSITSNLYKWFYCIYYNDEMPTNLCPYFWKVVIMYLLIVPYTVVCLPMLILGMIPTNRGGYKTEMGERIAVSIAAYFVIGAMSTMVLMFWATSDSIVFVLGTLLWFCATLWAIVHLTNKLRVKLSRSIPQKERVTKVNLLTEFVKAKYNRYCPQIEWK